MVDPTGDEVFVSSAPFIVEQWTAGKAPGEIEAGLIARGESPRVARDAVEDALTGLTESLQKSASQDQLVGILSLLFLPLVFLVCVGRCFFEAGLEWPWRVGLFVVGVITGLRILVAILRLLQSRTTGQEIRRLDRAWDRWKKERARRLAAPPAEDIPFAELAPAAPAHALLAQVPPPLPPARASHDRPQPTRPRDIRKARPAKVPEDTSLGLWVSGSVVGAVGVVGTFLLVVGLVVSASLGNSGSASAKAGVAPSTGTVAPFLPFGGAPPPVVPAPVVPDPIVPPPVAPPPKPIDPNAPLEDEGPAPRGWTALFRADDPAVWNTDSPGEKFALRVRQAHSTIRYLRLVRVDTGERLILPMTHKQLVREDRPGLAGESWWNGTARPAGGGRSLGIVQLPLGREPPGRLIGIANSEGNFFLGSGFGWKLRIDDGQYACWQGKEIPKTAFEIAVTADPLTAEEKAWLVAAETPEGPPRGWTTLFRSDDPSIWNTVSPGKDFAIPASRAHGKIRYLRLKRMDTKAVQIVPITRDRLAGQPTLPILKGVEWNGTNRLEYGGWHLGIIRGPRLDWPGFKHGTISVMNEGWNGFAGSGFGHKIGGADKQCYCWQGEEIPRTAFEIAVTVGPLTPEEAKQVAK
jgi:hypothetical protein